MVKVQRALERQAIRSIELLEELCEMLRETDDTEDTERLANVEELITAAHQFQRERHGPASAAGHFVAAAVTVGPPGAAGPPGARCKNSVAEDGGRFLVES